MAEFSTSHDIYDEARPWQWRVVRASMGTTTGQIVMAVLGKRPRYGYAFGENCDIQADGMVDCNIRHPQQGTWHRANIGKIHDVRDNFRRLADHCKLSDADRESLFTELRKWVRKDHRAVSEA